MAENYDDYQELLDYYKALDYSKALQLSRDWKYTPSADRQEIRLDPESFSSYKEHLARIEAEWRANYAECRLEATEDSGKFMKYVDVGEQIVTYSIEYGGVREAMISKNLAIGISAAVVGKGLDLAWTAAKWYVADAAMEFFAARCVKPPGKSLRLD